MTHENVFPGLETSNLPPQDNQFVGHVALLEPKSGLRTELIDGFAVETNLPEGMLPFEPTIPGEQPQHPFRRPLLPSAVDAIPTGTYTIGNPDSPETTSFDRDITVTEEADGKRINYIGEGLVKNAGNNTRLMTELGYKFKQGYNGLQVESVPTPETVRRKAALLGVDVQLFPDQGVIDSPGYLGAFAEGKYPVSTGSAEYYAHDISDDHITAMALGGDPLKAALADAAKNALHGEADLDEQAGGFDQFTAYLRGTVSPTFNGMPMPYGKETLRIAGSRIGIAPEKVDEILETARTNAQKFGMDVNQAA